MKIVFATNNKHKLHEIRKITAGSMEILSLSEINCHEEIPETGATLEENALMKAQFIKDKFGFDCFADDTGLEVDALDGEPGVYSARYAGLDATDAANNEKLLTVLKEVPPSGRTARFRSVLVLAGPDGSLLLVDGVCEGVILDEARGTGGFGYDPLFYMPSQGKTLAEMTIEEKNRISHRGNALYAFKHLVLQANRQD